MKATVLADGQEVEIVTTGDVAVLVAPGDMLVEVAPGQNYMDIGPEQTVKCANELEQEQWLLIREVPKFRGWWEQLWQTVQPPMVLGKSNLAQRHVVGLILMLVRAKQEGMKSHILYPETYLHPAQCQRLMVLIYAVTGIKE
jgi:hypothetical protein